MRVCFRPVRFKGGVFVRARRERGPLSSGAPAAGFVETEDYVELDGERICKPFVEKPASGEGLV